MERDGADHIESDLWVPAQTGETWDIMVFTTLDERLLTINFNAPSYLAEEWAAAGERIVESVRVRECEAGITRARRPTLTFMALPALTHTTRFAYIKRCAAQRG